MSGHGAIIPENVIRRLPSQVSQITQGLLIAVGIASTTISLAGEWSHGRNFLNQWLLGNFAILGAILNLLLVALVLFPGRIENLNEDVASQEVRLAARCINYFCLRALSWFWVCLGFVYVTLLYRNTVGSYDHGPIHFENEGISATFSAALLDLSSVGSTFFIYLAYRFLTPKFLQDCAKWHRRNSRPMRWTDSRDFWLSLALVVPVCMGVVLLRLFVLDLPDPFQVDGVLSIILGLASAVALGHFVGRMDSKFILDWQWVIPVLFVYAGIQVYSAVIYETAPINRAAFVYGAFTMKCVLFVFQSNFFETRRALYYAVELIESEDRHI